MHEVFPWFSATVRRVQTVTFFRCNGDGRATPRADLTMADLLCEHGIAEDSVFGLVRPKVFMDLYVRGAIPILLLKKPKKLTSDMGRVWNNVGHSAAEHFAEFVFTFRVEDPRSVRGLQRAFGDGPYKLKGVASAMKHHHGSAGLTDLIGIIKTMEGALKGTDVVSNKQLS